MILKTIGMIAADTSRSRAYIQAMIRNKLIPQPIFILANEQDKVLPGQTKGLNNVYDKSFDNEEDCWSELNNKLNEPIKITLKNESIKYHELKTSDLHDDEVINHLKSIDQSVIIYSGYGGVIIRKKIFLLGKRLLHVHGGYLPFYKGSTTNYYSILAENTISASSLFLNEYIDSGPVLHRKLFKMPKDLTKFDHIHDNAARAKVLIETIKNYLDDGSFKQIEILDEGEVFYIIHPILKHLAILSNRCQ